MTQVAHTPGKVRYVPWHVEEGAPAIRTADDWLLCATSSDADAERIADCWNACEGIPDPSVVGEAIEALRLIRSILHWYDGDTNALGSAHKVANDVLAKLDGAA